MLAGLLHAGTLVPIIDRTYDLAEIAEAYRYVETGHKWGTAVMTL